MINYKYIFIIGKWLIFNYVNHVITIYYIVFKEIQSIHAISDYFFLFVDKHKIYGWDTKKTTCGNMSCIEQLTLCNGKIS